MPDKKDKTNNPKIKIIKDGPYIVTGNVPLSEKIIKSHGHVNEFVDGCKFPQKEEYTLCRCGHSKSAPYCDGSHVDIGFDGTETASKEKFDKRAEFIEGEEIDLLDDGRCAFARFCHQEDGDVWELTEKSGDPKLKEQAIKAAYECPSGRLVSLDKHGKKIEPEYEPSIEIIQDPEKLCSGGLFVKGNIPIESADGDTYELRNRVVLCRCGKSMNKPFCDAMHVTTGYSDK